MSASLELVIEAAAIDIGVQRMQSGLKLAARFRGLSVDPLYVLGCDRFIRSLIYVVGFFGLPRPRSAVVGRLRGVIRATP